MLVLGALFALLAIGVWLYCLVDILLTSRSGCRHLPKSAWLAIVTLTFVVGSVAWLLLGRPLAATSRWSPRRHSPFHGPLHRGRADQRTAMARSRHPAGRARAIGPDDDPEFLRALDHMIRGDYEPGNDL
jgi:hypothetical protein